MSGEIKKWVQRNSVTLLLLLFCCLMAAFISFQTGKFFDWTNFVNILEANSYRLLLALGMMLVIASGAIGRYYYYSQTEFRRAQRRHKYGNGRNLRRDYGRHHTPWRQG